MVDERKDVSEVPGEVLGYLQRISDRSGRSISEIAAKMVVQGVELCELEQFDR